MALIRNRKRRRQRGQAFIEYVILVAVIALAALFTLASFSDRLRGIINGITETLGGSKGDKADTSSLDIVKDLNSNGSGN